MNIHDTVDKLNDYIDEIHRAGYPDTEELHMAAMHILEGGNGILEAYLNIGCQAGRMIADANALSSIANKLMYFAEKITLSDGEENN